MPRIHSNTVVIGSGPAGLAAAWAARHMGRDPIILTPEAKLNELQGAQYLHSHIPATGAGDNPFTVTYIKHGNKEGYARKIYGMDFDPDLTSWDKFPEGEVKAWSLRKVYKNMFLRFMRDERFVVGAPLGWKAVFGLCETFKLVIWTGPLNIFPGEFEEEEVFIVPSANDSIGHNEIHYYGDVSTPAYRASDVLGARFTEYPVAVAGTVNLPTIGVKIKKPLVARLSVETPPNLILAGRYGQWKKGVLVDHVYRDVLERIKQSDLG